MYVSLCIRSNPYIKLIKKNTLLYLPKLLNPHRAYIRESLHFTSLHFTSRALSRGGVGGPDPSSPNVYVVCIFWHLPQFPHVQVHKIAPSPSGSASWSPSGCFLFPTVHMPKPSEPALPCFAFYTPYL